MTAGFELRGLRAGYPGRAVIDGLDLPTVPPGALVAVVGPNAAGKSTLLRAVAGLRPAEGSVLLDGDDLARLPARERLLRAGYLPQALPQASSLLAYEALLSALRAGRPELQRRQVEDAIAATLRTLGLEALALRRLDQLSGGQRQMMGLAQVMVREPRLLLLDEPTSALDLRWQLRVLDAVQALARRTGTIALIALHDLNLALRYCDRMVVLAPGMPPATGVPADVLDTALLQRAWGIQARIERCSLGHPLVIADCALDGDLSHDPAEASP